MARTHDARTAPFLPSVRPGGSTSAKEPKIQAFTQLGDAVRDVRTTAGGVAFGRGDRGRVDDLLQCPYAITGNILGINSPRRVTGVVRSFYHTFFVLRPLLESDRIQQISLVDHLFYLFNLSPSS